MSSPSRPVRLTDEARDDLRSIALYGIESWGVQQAAQYHAEIENLLLTLSSFPHLGRGRTDWPGDLRAIRVGEHSVFYRVGEQAILVLRILHVRMDAMLHLDL